MSVKIIDPKDIQDSSPEEMDNRSYLADVSPASAVRNWVPKTMQTQVWQTLATGSDLINRSYLAELRNYTVLPSESEVALNIAGDVKIFRV